MRKNLLKLSVVLAAGMLIGGTEGVYAQKSKTNVRTETKAKSFTRLNARMAEGNNINTDPCKENYYTFDEEKNELVLAETRSYEYVKPGLANRVRIISNENNNFSEELYKYNENDQLYEFVVGSSDNGFDDILFNKMTTRAYEDIVKDFVVKEILFTNENKDAALEPSWKKTYSEIHAVERDDDNKVVSIADTLNFAWGGSQVDVTEYTYGEGTAPTEICFIAYGAKGKHIAGKLEQIKWDKCGDEIFTKDKLRNMVNGEDYAESRIASLTQRRYDNYNDYVYTGHNDYKMEYDENNRPVKMCCDSYDENENRKSRSYINTVYDDEFGSKTEKKFIYKDLNNDFVIGDDETEVYNSDIKKTIYDDKGNIVKIVEIYYGDNVEEQMHDETIYDYTYDDLGRVVEVVRSEAFNDNVELRDKHTFEYDDTTTGIASVNRDNIDMKVSGNVVTFGSTEGRYMVSNADGKLVMSGSAADGWVSLENLPAGLYIVKVNGQAVKVIR